MINRCVARGRGIEVLQFIIYLVVLAVGSVSTAAWWWRLIFISPNGMPCLTVRTKELREFKQGLVSYGGEHYKEKLNYQCRYSNMLNYRMENDCTYVRENCLAPFEAASVEQHREIHHMVFTFPRYSYSLYSAPFTLFNISFSNLFSSI